MTCLCGHPAADHQDARPGDCGPCLLCGWESPWPDDDEPEITWALHDLVAHAADDVVAEAEKAREG